MLFRTTQRRQNLKAHAPKLSAFLNALLEQTEIAQIAELGQRFWTMARERNGHEFDGWIKAVRECTSAELNNFATGLLQDEAAVRNGLSLKWSNGQVEGQVNRLKLKCGQT